MKERIITIIIEYLKDLNEDLKILELKNATEKTHLYGAKGNLDSLALVTLITNLEETISEKFGKTIVLADERAVSQTKSPFRTVESLADYIESLLHEAEK